MNVLRNAIFTKLVLLLKISLQQRSKKEIELTQNTKKNQKFKAEEKIKSSVSKMKIKTIKIC